MIALRVLAVLAAAWLTCFASLDALTRSAAGRTWFVNELLSAISDGMRGSMSVGRCDHLSFQTWTVAAHDFRVEDETGAEVLRVNHAVITIDPGSLLDGDVRITRARGVDGQLEITERADGESGIDRAFQGTNSGDGFALQPVVRFDRIDAVNVRVHIAAPGADLVARGVRGEVALTAGSTVPTRVRIRRTRGHLQLSEPISAELRVLSVHGRLDTSHPRRFDARVEARFLGDPLEGRVGIVRGTDGVSRFVADADGEGFFGDLGDALVDVLGTL